MDGHQLTVIEIVNAATEISLERVRIIVHEHLFKYDKVEIAKVSRLVTNDQFTTHPFYSSVLEQSNFIENSIAPELFFQFGDVPFFRQKTC